MTSSLIVEQSVIDAEKIPPRPILKPLTSTILLTNATVIAFCPAIAEQQPPGDIAPELVKELRTQIIHDRARVRADKICAALPALVLASASEARLELHLLHAVCPSFTYSPGLRHIVMKDQWDEDVEVANLIEQACRAMPGMSIPSHDKKYRLMAVRRHGQGQGASTFSLVVIWTVY